MGIMSDAGFPPGSDHRVADYPDFGGPVRDGESGEYVFPPEHALVDDWARMRGGVCGGCCGAVPQLPKPLIPGVGTDAGDSGLAVGRAAGMLGAVRGWVPPGALATEWCGTFGGPLRVNLAVGNVLAEVRTPAGSGIDPIPILTYNSRSTTASEYGMGWSGMYGQKVVDSGGLEADVTKGTGTELRYTSLDPTSGYYTPQAGARNALQKNADGTYTETQPNGFQLHYDSTGRLARLANAAGSRWTLTHDAGGRVTKIADPSGGRTTSTYDASDKLKRIEDTSGRITSFTVDGSGNLTQVTGPELCITEFRYDGTPRLIARISPEGSRTSFGYDATTGRVNQMTSPDGARTSYVYLTGGVRYALDAEGVRTTLLYTLQNALKVALDGTGSRTTYSWDQVRLSRVEDAAGAITSFGYVTLSDNTSRLVRLETAVGGIFTYSYGNPTNTIQRLLDAGGHITTLIWDSSQKRMRLAEIDLVTLPEIFA